MINLAVFASGNGTNTQRLIDHFNDHDRIKIALVLSNRPDAFVLKRAANAGIPSAVCNKTDFMQGTTVFHILEERSIDFIILAGFLLHIPPGIIERYAQRMINIHPALLPAYGGKGMYGMHVHEAVIRSGDKQSGITIHYINERYDDGQIIFQASCQLDENETAESLAIKIHALEYEHFPKVAEAVIDRSFPRC
jgi:phosphoribosylglycinamide formyltransferase 1